MAASKDADVIGRLENPFLNEDLCVGRAAERARILEYLNSGRSALLIGGRRAGKTNLIRNLGLLKRATFHVDAGGWQLGSETAAIAQLGAALHTTCNDRDGLRAALKQKAPLAILIDEADKFLSEPWAGGFLSFLRALDGTELRRDLSVLLVGGPVLAGYRNPDDHGSPPLNLSEPIYLEPLDVAARNELLALHGNLSSKDAKAVLHYGAAHPWLLTRLLASLWDYGELNRAVERVFEIAVSGNFEVWRRQLGTDGSALLATLTDRGVTRAAFRSDGRLGHLDRAFVLTRCLCLVRCDQNKVYPGPRLFLDWLAHRGGQRADVQAAWDLAISYASADEALARSIHEQLKARHRVFFAPAQQAYLWGQNLNNALPHVYGETSRFVLVLSTPAYVDRHWTMVEFEAAQRQNPGRVLVVDCGALPIGLPHDVVYRKSSPAELVSLVATLDQLLLRHGNALP